MCAGEAIVYGCVIELSNPVSARHDAWRERASAARRRGLLGHAGRLLDHRRLRSPQGRRAKALARLWFIPRRVFAARLGLLSGVCTSASNTAAKAVYARSHCRAQRHLWMRFIYLRDFQSRAANFHWSCSKEATSCDTDGSTAADAASGIDCRLVCNCHRDSCVNEYRVSRIRTRSLVRDDQSLHANIHGNHWPIRLW